MTTYTTKDGDMLDRICYKYYGSESAVIDVMEANPGLAELGPIFDAGVVIILPDRATPEADEGINIWD